MWMWDVGPHTTYNIPKVLSIYISINNYYLKNVKIRPVTNLRPYFKDTNTIK